MRVLANYLIVVMVVVGISGCEGEILGYDISIVKDSNAQRKPTLSREQKLDRVYKVISTGDSEELVLEAMGNPDLITKGNGTFVNIDTYTWITNNGSYEIKFIYGRVKEKSQQLGQI